MPPRKTFKKPTEWRDIARWHQCRSARAARNYQPTLYKLVGTGRVVTTPDTAVVAVVIMDGKIYDIDPPRRILAGVRYVIDVVDGKASFEVDVSMNSNWNEPETPHRTLISVAKGRMRPCQQNSNAAAMIEMNLDGVT